MLLSPVVLSVRPPDDEVLPVKPDVVVVLLSPVEEPPKPRYDLTVSTTPPLWEFCFSRPLPEPRVEPLTPSPVPPGAAVLAEMCSMPSACWRSVGWKR